MELLRQEEPVDDGVMVSLPPMPAEAWSSEAPASSVGRAILPRRTIVLAAWLALVWFAMAGVTDGLQGLGFLCLVIAPCAIVVHRVVLRLGLPAGLAASLSGGLTLSLVPFLFLGRKTLPLSGPVADVALCALLLASAALALRSWPGSRPGLPEVSFPMAILLAMVIPVVFFAPMAGFAVRSGGDVSFYGPNLMDFGNLSVVVNLLSLDGLGVPAPVDTCGTFAYHWLYFAAPAWMGQFFGREMGAGAALTLMNLVTAIVFFQCLSLACKEALQRAGIPDCERWGPTGAGIGVLAASTTYFYNFAGKFHLVPISERNHLMLQLPSSMSAFGNNTLALCLVMLALLLLARWNDDLRLSRVLLAAALVALVPALSITLAPAVAFGVGVACVAGTVRRGWMALGIFTFAAGVSWLLLVGLDYLSGSRNQAVLDFDSGQFLQNIALGLPLVALALGWCVMRERSAFVALLGMMIAGSIVVPTWVLIAGDPAVLSAMSMKNATLVIACGTPLITVAMARLLRAQEGGRFRVLRMAALMLVVLGLLNTTGYLLATPLSRAGMGLQPKITLPADYVAALHHVRATTPRSTLLLDPLAAENTDSNPAVLFAARRVILPSVYDLTWGFTNPEIKRRQEATKKWVDSKFSDESQAACLAACSDCFIAPGPVESAHWKLDSRFGTFAVYHSASRTGLAESHTLSR